MTKMAAMTIYSKKPSKSFFSDTGGPISMNVKEGNDQEMAQREIPFQNSRWKKKLILTHLAYIANGKKNVLYCATISLGE